MTSNNVEEKSANPVAQATVPGYRHHRTVPALQQHDGKDLYLPMVVMTSREAAEVEAKCYQDTLALFNGKSPKKDEPSNWDQQLEAQRALWTIYYTMRTPGELSKKWFIDKAQVQDTYNWDEADILMADYLTVRMTQPHLLNLDAEDPNAIQKAFDTIKRLGSESDFFLNGFTTQSANLLIKSLVAQLVSLQNTSGLSG